MVATQVGGWTMEDRELEVMAGIRELLDSLEGEDTRERVLRWAGSRFGVRDIGQEREGANGDTGEVRVVEAGDTREIPGIATFSERAGFELTVRDPKARSTVDAAIRLAYVTVYAYERLTGAEQVPPGVVVDALTDWRVYDGNTRKAIAAEKGLLRSGYKRYLDTPGKKHARKLVGEMLNDSTKGEWEPPARARKKKGRRKKAK